MNNSLKGGDELEPPHKKMKTERHFIDAASFQRMKQSMDEADLARENLIKRTRDVQKLSKQAIFSLVSSHLLLYVGVYLYMKTSIGETLPKPRYN